MSRFGMEDFDEVWLVDFEFGAVDGERPEPVCMVALELKSRRLIRLFGNDLTTRPAPPFRIDAAVLFVAYFATAELSCHLKLGWPLPARILDLYVEFRCLTNGLPLSSGAGLVGAMVHFGLNCMAAAVKAEMRRLVLRGGPWTNDERAAILDYCQSDVDTLALLLGRMAATLDLPRALLRGRYMAAVAQIEARGIPIDLPAFQALSGHWDGIKAHLIEAVDASFGVYDGPTFKESRFEAFLATAEIPWPRHASGRLDLSEATFREMARANTRVSPLHELRTTTSQLRLSDLAVGHDGRNRCLLSPFRSKTGRNQPSNSRFAFGPAVWLRGLIKPEPGWGLAYIDWSQQEFGIAGALSGDEAMMAAYRSGDPYLTFAKQAGAVPAGATKASHKRERELFKQCALAVQYGMGARSLGGRIGKPEFVGADLLRLHRHTYPVYWRWNNAAVAQAVFHGTLWTRFGWQVRAVGDVNCRSMANFPMQANGAEMLRLACCLATERGVGVCAPVHDAVLIEAPLADLPAAVAEMEACMVEASEVLLDGFQLRTDAKVVAFPDRYMDERGAVMWNTVTGIVAKLVAGDAR